MSWKEGKGEAGVKLNLNVPISCHNLKQEETHTNYAGTLAASRPGFRTRIRPKTGCFGLNRIRFSKYSRIRSSKYGQIRFAILGQIRYEQQCNIF